MQHKRPKILQEDLPLLFASSDDASSAASSDDARSGDAAARSSSGNYSVQGLEDGQFQRELHNRVQHATVVLFC
jgi:hypothetical protein